MISDRWLKVGAVFGVIACVAFAVACGGGGGKVGTSAPTTQVAFLNGSVSYVSGAAKPMAKASGSGKPGAAGTSIYQVSMASKDDLTGVDNAIVQLFRFDDTDFSDPLAQTITNADGSYTFNESDFLAGHDATDYKELALVVRSMFESKMTAGKYVALSNLIDRSDVTDVATYSAGIDPITNAITASIIDLFMEMGVPLTDALYRELEAFVALVVETMEKEATFTLDEDAIAVDTNVYAGALTGEFVASAMNSEAATSVDSTAIGSALSWLETEAGETFMEMESAGTITVELDEDAILAKYINWLTMMGFMVDEAVDLNGDGTKTALLYVRVRTFVPDPVDPNAMVDVVDKLVNTAGSGVYIPTGEGFAANVVLIDPGKLFERDAGVAADQVWDLSNLKIIDLESQAYAWGPPIFTDWQLAAAVNVVWDRMNDKNAVFAKQVVKTLAITRRNERCTILEIAQTIASMFEWWVEDMDTMGGMIHHMGERKMDMTKGDISSATVEKDDVLTALDVGKAIPDNAFDYAAQILSIPTNIVRLADSTFMDITFQEWKRYEEVHRNPDGSFDTTVMYDPYMMIFSKVDTFDKVVAVVTATSTADYDLDGNGTIDLVSFDGQPMPVSNIYAKELEKLQQMLIGSLPSAWFGSTIQQTTEANFKATILMIMKVLDQEYLVQPALGYMRERTDPWSGKTFVEPRFDNFKWLKPTQTVMEASVAPGVDPVIKEFLESLFDGTDPGGTAYEDPDGTDLTQLSYPSSSAAISMATLLEIQNYGLFFHGEFHAAIDMIEVTSDADMLDDISIAINQEHATTPDSTYTGAEIASYDNAFVTFAVEDFYGTDVPPADVTNITVYNSYTGAEIATTASIATAASITPEGGATDSIVTISAAIPTEQDYRFKFEFEPDIRTDNPEIFIWIPRYVDDSTGTAIFTMDWPFMLPPLGGFETWDFPHIGVGPGEGLLLSGFETGMEWISTDQMAPASCDLWLQPATDGSNNTWLNLGSGTRGLTISSMNTSTNQPEPFDLWELKETDLNTAYDWSNPDLPVSSRVLTFSADNFMWNDTDGNMYPDAPHYSGYTFGLVDASNRRYVVSICCFDQWSMWFGVRFAEVDAQGALSASQSTFYDTGGYIPPADGDPAPPPPMGAPPQIGSYWLCGGDYLSVETGAWSPPEPIWGYDATMAAEANFQYEAQWSSFNPAAPSNVMELSDKKMTAKNGCKIANVTNIILDANPVDGYVDSAIDVDNDGSANESFASIFSSISANNSIYVGTAGTMVALETSSLTYYLIQIVEVQNAWYDPGYGDWGPGNLYIAYAPTSEMIPNMGVVGETPPPTGGGTEPTPCDDSGTIYLDISDYYGYAEGYDFETWTYTEFSDGDMKLGGTWTDVYYQVNYGSGSIMEQPGLDWDAFDPATVHTGGVTSLYVGNPANFNFHSLITQEGNLVVFHVTSEGASDPMMQSSYNIEWRLYMMAGGGGAAGMNMPHYFPDPAIRLSQSKSFMWNSYNQDYTNFDGITDLTYLGEMSLPGGGNVTSTGIKRTNQASGMHKTEWYDYRADGVLVLHGFLKVYPSTPVKNRCVRYTPPLVVMPMDATMNYVTYTESAGQNYAVDSSGVVGDATGAPWYVEYWSSACIEPYVYTSAGEYTDCLWVDTELSIDYGTRIEEDDIFFAPDGIGIVKKWRYMETDSGGWWNTSESMSSYTP